FVASAGVEVELPGVAIPDLVVGADVGRLLVQAAQADVQVLLVPQKKELSSPIGQVGMADMHGGHESPGPTGQFALHRDRLLGLRNQADDGLVFSHGSAGRNGSDEEYEDQHSSTQDHVVSTSTRWARRRSIFTGEGDLPHWIQSLPMQYKCESVR